MRRSDAPNGAPLLAPDDRWVHLFFAGGKAKSKRQLAFFGSGTGPL